LKARNGALMWPARFRYSRAEKDRQHEARHQLLFLEGDLVFSEPPHIAK
jgi:hypothetical protein